MNIIIYHEGKEIASLPQSSGDLYADILGHLIYHGNLTAMYLLSIVC